MSEADAAPPPRFARMRSPGTFVNRAGQFFVREEENGDHTVGIWIGENQANSEGFAHGDFLLAFADFLRPARVGDWIEARIVERKRSGGLIFANAAATCAGREVLRFSGLVQPFEKKT